MSEAVEREVRLRAGTAELVGDLVVPAGAAGVVLFAHGSGSSRYSPRNRLVAGALRRVGQATLLLDLLTPAAPAGTTRSPTSSAVPARSRTSRSTASLTRAS